MIIIGLFWEALEENGLDDLLFSLEEAYDETWEKMSADEIWSAQAEHIGHDWDLPEDLLAFYSEEPDWEFAEANLRQYGQTF